MVSTIGSMTVEQSALVGALVIDFAIQLVSTGALLHYVFHSALSTFYNF